MSYSNSDLVCLDSSFVIDYWDGEEFAKEYLEGIDDDIGLPTVALFELYSGVLLSDSPTDDIITVNWDLDWTKPLPFTESAATAAAQIDTTLIERGERINGMDVLIAATARVNRAPLVATDKHFERVSDLEVINPRKANE